MKIKNKIFKAGITFAIMILTNSCLEYEITTRIHSDGSIERYFKVKGDEDMINEESSITLPADSTWEIKTWWELDDSSRNKPDSLYVYTARKTFKNYKEMNEELKNDPHIYKMVNMQVNLKKKFRWFYTFIQYTEIYQKHFPYNYLPLKDFLTEEELRYSLSDDEDYMFNPVNDKFEPVTETDTGIILTGKDSVRARELEKDIEKRFEEWQLRNVNEDYYNALSKVLSKKNPDAYQLLMDRKSEFYDSLDMENAPEYSDEQKEMLKIKKYVISRTSDFLGITENDILPTENPDIQSFFDRLTYMRLNEYYTYDHKTIMPGKVIQTNSTRLEDGNSTWSFRLRDFYDSDFVMTVESRIVNNWAIVASIATVVILLTGLITGFFKR